VKRFLAISFLSLYLNSYTEVHEVFRLPILLEHFTEHKALVADLTFWDFIKMHYESDVNHDTTDDELPFKVPGHSFTAISIVLLPLKINLTEAVPSALLSYTFDYKESFFSSSLQAIFQPPKLA
jgi:hypothetical protein